MMNGMYIRNFSLTCYGPNTGLVELLKSISEGAPVVMNADQIMIASFRCVLNLDEIETLLKDKNFSFFISEMNPDTSRGHTINSTMQEKLFDDFFYKRILDEGMSGTPFSGASFTGEMQDEYIDFEDLDASKLHSELYLKDLLGTLQEAIDEEEYEYAGELRDEIKEVDPEFYEENVKNNKFLK